MVLENRVSFKVEQLINKVTLEDRWPHATEAEIYDLHKQDKLRVFSYLKGPINGVLFCTPSSIGCWNNEYDFEYFDYYLMDDVLACEEQYPDFQGNIEAAPHDMSDIENWGKAGCTVKKVGKIDDTGKTDWRDCSAIQDGESLPQISDTLCRNNFVLAQDADGTICPPELASFPLKIFFTEMPRPDDGDYYTSHDLMERYKLGPAEFVEYLARHEDLYPYGVPDYIFSGNHIMSKKIEALGEAAFHYREIRSHEIWMKENGYYDKYYDEQQRRTIQNEINPTADSSQIVELKAQLAEAQDIIAKYKEIDTRTLYDFNGEWDQDSPEYIVALASTGEEDAALRIIKEKDASFVETAKELAELKSNIVATKEEPATNPRWEASTATVCKSVLEVFRSGRTDWTQGGNGELTDSAGDDTFHAVVMRLHPKDEMGVMTQAERAAWRALSDSGYTWPGGRKPKK